MHKTKVSIDLKLEIVKAYINEEGGFKSLAQKYGVSSSSIREWVWKYQEHGDKAFRMPSSANATYTSEFKFKCVQSVLSGEATINETVAKYNISSRSILRSWIKEYNVNGTLKDYDPKREVYMAEARRKTTLDERKKIVKYCIEYGNDYKNTASTFDVSYNQVYTWVKKYEEAGEEGLIDKRGRHKADDELDELDRLRRENARLKHQLKEKEMTVELLKKVKEFERK